MFWRCSYNDGGGAVGDEDDGDDGGDCDDDGDDDGGGDGCGGGGNGDGDGDGAADADEYDHDDDDDSSLAAKEVRDAMGGSICRRPSGHALLAPTRALCIPWSPAPKSP